VKTKKFLLITWLLSGAMILAACSSEATPETTPEETQELPKPEPTESIAYPYPYPEPGAGAQPINPAYPAPGEIVSDEPVVIDPYPGVVDDNNQRDPSDVLTLRDISALPADKNLQTGPVYIDYAEVTMKETDPVQVELMISGNLPTPCHQLRVITSKPDADGHIQIQAYSVSDPGKMCTQVLKPFEAEVPLGDYTEGNFTYSVNDEFVGKFQLP